MVHLKVEELSPWPFEFAYSQLTANLFICMFCNAPELVIDLGPRGFFGNGIKTFGCIDGLKELTGSKTISILALFPGAVAQIRIFGQNPNIAAASVENQTDILWGCANGHISIVAGSGDVVIQTLRKGGTFVVYRQRFVICPFDVNRHHLLGYGGGR